MQETNDSLIAGLLRLRAVVELQVASTHPLSPARADLERMASLCQLTLCAVEANQLHRASNLMREFHGLNVRINEALGVTGGGIGATLEA